MSSIVPEDYEVWRIQFKEEGSGRSCIDGGRPAEWLRPAGPVQDRSCIGSMKEGVSCMLIGEPVSLRLDRRGV
jgi:hypothetical protein